jgi:hypothetical protein
LNRFIPDFILKKLKWRSTRLTVSAFLYCTLISVTALAQEPSIVVERASKEKLKIDATWQEQLFAAYFDTIPRVAVDSHPARFARSVEQYKKLQADSVNLFKGIYELKKGNTRKSIAYFQKSLDGVQGLWYNNSTWYLGLAYLRLNELATAEYLINEISEMEIQPYQLLAAELYKQIIAKKIQTTK